MAEVRVLTTGEAAKYCGVNFRTIIRWIERGRLKAYKLPGRGDHRIQVGDFLAFLRENQMPVPQELVADAQSQENWVDDSGRRVLVVEDQAEMAAAIRRVLIRAGFDVVVASDGFKAGTLMAQHRPSLITLDLKMPGLDGYQVLEFIRSQPRYSGVKILVVSAQTPDNLQKALDQGADDVLVKPFENAELLARVENLIGLPLAS